MVCAPAAPAIVSAVIAIAMCLSFFIFRLSSDVAIATGLRQQSGCFVLIASSKACSQAKTCGASCCVEVIWFG